MQIVVLGLKISLSQLSMNAFLDDCVVFEQHLPVVFLQHGQLVGKSPGILSEQGYLTGVHLDPITALVLHFLHAFLQLQFIPALCLLLYFVNLFLTGCLGVGQLSLQIFLLALCIAFESDIVISSSPEILLTAIDFLFQIDYGCVLLIHDMECFLQLIVVAACLVCQFGLVEVFFCFRLIDFVLFVSSCTTSL